MNFKHKDAYLYMAIGDDMRRKIRRDRANRQLIVIMICNAVVVVACLVVWVVS